MYDYSPISKLYIKNFRNLGEVVIDFDQSPIVTLLGENEAGKTSVIKAFATCALHANPRDQKDYIRDGTQMFGVAIELKDGTRVTRIKEATGVNSYQVLRADGTKWSANKITDGLPAEVQKVIGLIEEPETNEFLHIRTYEDKLLFVVTPNSTNYKVMYNALKVEQLTKAIKLGSTEVNTLKSSINTNDISIQTLSAQNREITIYDVEPLTNIKARLTEQLTVLEKLERLKTLKQHTDECERQLGAVALIDRFNLNPINEVMAVKLASASRLLNNRYELVNYRNKLNEVDNCEIIDVSIATKLSGIIDKKNRLQQKMIDAGALVHISEISEISETLIMQLDRAEALSNKQKALGIELSKINTDSCNEITQSSIDAVNKLQKMHSMIQGLATKQSEVNQIDNYIVQVNNYMKQCGVAVETCPKCGEAVIFDVDKM